MGLVIKVFVMRGGLRGLDGDALVFLYILFIFNLDCRCLLLGDASLVGGLMGVLM